MTDQRERLRKIQTFPSLVKYLRDELDWPINSNDFDDLTFDYTPEEIGLDAATATKIDGIKRLRPLTATQPWGIFFIKFEPKQLPVVALRRILNKVIVKKRASANQSEMASWEMGNLILISSYGEGGNRQISFAHFTQSEDGSTLPALRILGWDSSDTPLHLDHVADVLAEQLAWPDDEENTDAWLEHWRSAFILTHRQVITTSRTLSVELAKLARNIRNRINSILSIETESGPVTRTFASVREALVENLTTDEFADMYAQTIAYGLLASRVAGTPEGHPEPTGAALAATNPFLQELMGTLIGISQSKGRSEARPDLDFDELGITEIIELLANSNMEAVLLDFGKENPHQDPVIYFYELFLTEYDAKKRMSRGVFYTPQPVVRHIIRSVDASLRSNLGLKDGLADTTTWGELSTVNPDLNIPEGIDPDECFVQILDPATGTGTFLVEAIHSIHSTLTSRWLEEGHSSSEIQELWSNYVPESLLPRLHGYELMMAPYAIANLKIGLKLIETGYQFKRGDRIAVYLTNALEPPTDQTDRLEDVLPALAIEAKSVNRLKASKAFTVIVGNPPYSKMSGNLGEAAVALIEPFRYVDGERIKEKGALALELNLQDDYVKFWGLLLHLLRDSGAGVGGFISNSRYLSAPTLRGFRSVLREAFSEASFIDLGGQVSERTDNSEVDENVFDIVQGVAIATVTRLPGKNQLATITTRRIYGQRDEKLRALSSNPSDSELVEILPSPPYYSFSRGIDEADEEFLQWRRLDELMPFNSGGLITSRDNLAIGFSKTELLENITRFATSKAGDTSLQDEIGFSVKSKWDVERCKSEIRGLDDLEGQVERLLYRPFDERFIFYLPSLIDTPSRPVCRSVWGNENLVLLTPAVKTTADFSHALVSRVPAETKSCSHDRATQMFPQFRAGDGLLPAPEANLSHTRDLAPDETDWIPYVYGILHSPGYRTRYGRALQDSYPHIPETLSDSLLEQLVDCGRSLIALHLLDGLTASDSAPGSWCGPESPRVERVSYSDETVWVDRNRTQGFQGVTHAIWKFKVGGYQVCEKWLKDRQPKGGKNPRPGRILTAEDIAHYQMVVIALTETVQMMRRIEDAIEGHGGWPDAFTSG